MSIRDINWVIVNHTFDTAAGIPEAAIRMCGTEARRIVEGYYGTLKHITETWDRVDDEMEGPSGSNHNSCEYPLYHIKMVDPSEEHARANHTLYRKTYDCVALPTGYTLTITIPVWNMVPACIRFTIMPTGSHYTGNDKQLYEVGDVALEGGADDSVESMATAWRRQVQDEDAEADNDEDP